MKRERGIRFFSCRNNNWEGHGSIACPELAEALSAVEGEVEGCRHLPSTCHPEPSRIIRLRMILRSRGICSCCRNAAIESNPQRLKPHFLSCIRHD